MRGFDHLFPPHHNNSHRHPNVGDSREDGCLLKKQTNRLVDLSGYLNNEKTNIIRSNKKEQEAR